MEGKESKLDNTNTYRIGNIKWVATRVTNTGSVHIRTEKKFYMVDFKDISRGKGCTSNIYK